MSVKRYSAHFLYATHCGFLKQQVVEVENGYVRNYFPLSEELENVEWFPGVILLLTMAEVLRLETDPGSAQEYTEFFVKQINVSPSLSSPPLIPILLFPFDFIEMKPVSGTRHRRLL